MCHWWGFYHPTLLTYTGAMRFLAGIGIKYPCSVFRRRSDSSDATSAAEIEAAKERGKGRPTPKRSEAERLKRNQLISAPQSRKEAYKKTRERQATNRAKAQESIKRGETKFLPKRDQGPVRKLARDYVDSRRTVGQYLMFVVFGVILLSFTQQTVFQLLFVLVPPIMLAVVLTESLLISQKVKKLAKERFPDESLKGVGLYAATRAMQVRRLRFPAPVVTRADKNRI